MKDLQMGRRTIDSERPLFLKSWTFAEGLVKFLGGLPEIGERCTGAMGCRVLGPQSIELKCLFSLQKARTTFFREIISHAKNYSNSGPPGSKKEITKEDVDVLRGNGTYHIAEFYYCVQEYNLGDRQNIIFFLKSHNEGMQEYISNKENCDLIGFSKSGAEEAIFSEVQIEKVVQNISGNTLRLDQSDVGRILLPMISPETTRKALVTLDKGGLITRIKIGQVLIVSTGTLEKYFREHLSSIVKTIAEESERPREARL